MQPSGDEVIRPGYSPTEASRKLAILKQVFDHVVDMDRHEDEKAGRILAPMAFLTVAYAAVFASFMTNKIGFISYSFDFITLAFLAYIVCATLGTIYMLEAFGPRFNVPKPWKSDDSKGAEVEVQSKEQSSQSKVPKSIFFFELIGKEPRADWTKYFSNPANVLEQKALEDLAYEIHLISEKASTKVHFVKLGKFFFYFAMLFLVLGTLLGAISIFIRAN